MIRRVTLRSAGLIAAAVFTVVTSQNATAWFGPGVNSSYISFCRSGNCGGGNHIIGGWCHGCRGCQGHRAGTYNYGATVSQGATSTLGSYGNYGNISTPVIGGAIPNLTPPSPAPPKMPSQ